MRTKIRGEHRLQLENVRVFGISGVGGRRGISGRVPFSIRCTIALRVVRNPDSPPSAFRYYATVKDSKVKVELVRCMLQINLLTVVQWSGVFSSCYHSSSSANSAPIRVARPCLLPPNARLPRGTSEQCQLCVLQERRPIECKLYQQWTYSNLGRYVCIQVV